MLSSDNNIETIAELIENLKRYVSLQKEYAQVSLVEKTVRITSMILVFIVSAILALLVLVCISIAVALALASSWGYVGAFAAVGGFYLVVLILVYANKGNWIERPLVRALSKMLLN